MPENNTDEKMDRRLGDEWVDWNGEIDTSADADPRIFIGTAMAAIVVILGITALFVWLVYPRLLQMSSMAGPVINFSYLTFASILVAWLILFIWGALTRRPFLSGLVVVPKLVNLLLDITIKIGKVFGISKDRLINSFLKLHNLFIDSDPLRVPTDKIMLLLPRCLSKEMFKAIKSMRESYGFIMATAGGGGEARNKIRKMRPGLIIAVACERDLLSGFIDVNPHIPVIGFPNIRPSGPCKDTEVNLQTIESTIKRHSIPDKQIKNERI
ncbi:MAG: DUF116 domain-containing protein [Candidatus Zixiibacteriota bacterium]